MKHKALAVTIALGPLALTPVAAMAQAWIGQVVGDMMAQQAAAAQELACMKGQAMPPNEVAEAGGPAPAVMRAYWDAVKAGQSPAASFIIDRRTRWNHGPTAIDRGGIARIRDPFAASGLVLVEQPVGFVRAGDANTALGQWAVTDAAGRRSGTYQALLRRQQGRWLISTLELVDATRWIDPVVQYCHAPSDVLPLRVTHTRGNLSYAESRERRARERLARTVARAEEAEAEATASPNNSRRAESARAARAEVAAREVDLAERIAPLDAARAEEAQARADMAAYEAMRAAGMAALPTS